MKTTLIGEQTGPDEQVSQNDTIQMRLEATATPHLMKVLYSIYPNPVKAVVRELASNALDAHERAGQTRPIEITFPTANEPGPLVIQDFGLGMDKADLDNYAAYGFSDKGDSNDERGGFGLGSKSPLALQRPYLVETVKNGQYFRVKVHVEGRNAGVFEFLEQRATNEGNGVKITIPLDASQVQQVQVLTRDFFRTQTQGAVMVNGRLITNTVHGPDHLRIGALGDTYGWVRLGERPEETTRAIRNGDPLYSSNYDLRLVVGGVVYEVPRESPFRPGENSRYNQEPEHYLQAVDARYRQMRLSNATMYVVLPIGSVTFISSREAIELNEANKRTILHGINRFLDMLEPVATNHMQTLPDMGAAAAFYAENWGILGGGKTFGHAVVSRAFGANRDLVSIKPEKAPMWRGQALPINIDLTIEPERATWSRIQSYWQQGQDTAQVRHIGFLRAVRGEVARVRSEQQYGPERTLIIQTHEYTPDLVLDKVKNNIRIYGQYHHETRNMVAYLTTARNLNPWLAATFDVVSYSDFMVGVAEAREAAKSGRIKRDRPTLKYPVLSKRANPNRYAGGDEYTLDEVEAGKLGAQVYISQDDCKHSMMNTLWRDMRLGRGSNDNAAKALAHRVAGGNVMLLIASRSEANLLKQAPGVHSATDTVWQTYKNLPNKRDRQAVLALHSMFHDTYDLTKFKNLATRTGGAFAHPVVQRAAAIALAGERDPLYKLAEQVALLIPGLHKRAEVEGRDSQALLVDNVQVADTIDMFGHLPGMNDKRMDKFVAVVNFMHPRP